jgi:hypothetical protein
MKSIGIAFLLALIGCNSSQLSPLVGRWSRANTEASARGVNITDTYEFLADGKASFTVTGTSNCIGTISTTGLNWSASGDTLTLSGNQTCAGMFTCMINGNSVPSGCGTAPPPATFSFRYMLSADKNTLTLTPPSDAGSLPDVTYTRAP